MSGPLEGFRVVDLTSMVSGPVATMMLADQGADVIKIEPRQGELMRQVGIDNNGMTTSFVSTNRGKRSLCEDEYAYDVALRLCRLLISHGATAYMILRDDNDGIRSGEILPCDKDETVWGGASIPAWQKVRLTQRSDIINELYDRNQLAGVTDQLAIAIHVDSRSSKKRIDAFFCHHYTSDAGKKIAQNLYNTFKQKYAIYQKGRGYWGEVESRDLHMLRECKPVSVFVELANIKNYADQQRLIIEKNRQLLAEWLFEGLTK